VAIDVLVDGVLLLVGEKFAVDFSDDGACGGIRMLWFRTGIPGRVKSNTAGSTRKLAADMVSERWPRLPFPQLEGTDSALD
jgi:hypothetical protein